MYALTPPGGAARRRQGADGTIVSRKFVIGEYALTSPGGAPQGWPDADDTPVDVAYVLLHPEVLPLDGSKQIIRLTCAGYPAGPALAGVLLAPPEVYLSVLEYDDVAVWSDSGPLGRGYPSVDS